ncbi:MAG TPA: sigma-70 family RNA polymerase sigma factor, partial [Planctomycetota bacterium]|nr:sigma-70 family RNA polymerase sigma factor [Planctomycetota bacterium]
MTAPAQEQFTRLWTQAHPAIAGYVTAVVTDPHAADDVLQEVALTLLRKFSDYDPTRPFTAWAMGVAKTAILSERRDRARALSRLRPATVESLEQVWQEILPTADARRGALTDCLRGVSGRSRELVVLRYEEAIEPQDIATRLGMTAVAVRVALTRIRAALQTCIEKRLTQSP